MRIFFELARPTPPGYCYQHLAICLAEGLSELGVSFRGNIDYWPLDDGNFLINKGPRREDDVLVANSEILARQPYHFPNCMLKAPNERKVCLYDFDMEHREQPMVRKFNIIFKCHYVSGDSLVSYRPWAFGISRRMLDHCTPQKERRWEVAVNWRASHPVRTWAEEVLFPRIEEKIPVRKVVDDRQNSPQDESAVPLWERTGRRHYPEYYERLSQTAMCACFGGLPKAGKVYQFDSWRLWESWAAGCVPIHIDLERYRCVLPVMPKSGEHFVGFEFHDIDKGLRMLEPDIIAELSQRGREWAMKHYSPKAVAERFLEAVDRYGTW